MNRARHSKRKHRHGVVFNDDGVWHQVAEGRV